MMKEQNKPLELSEFKDSIKGHGNLYTNRHGVDIDITNTVSARLEIWSGRPTEFDLVLEMDARDFMKEFEIQTWEDVEAIEESALWAQYSKGNAYVCAGLFEFLDMDLCFRVSEGQTLVFTDPKGRFEAMSEHVMLDVNWFRAYVKMNMSKLYGASEGING